MIIDLYDNDTNCLPVISYIINNKLLNTCIIFIAG